MSMNARLHLVGYVSPAALILCDQRNQLSYLDNVRVHVGVEKQTLIGQKELETQSKDEDGKKVFDRIDVDKDKVESWIRCRNHILLQCGEEQTGIEGVLR